MKLHRWAAWLIWGDAIFAPGMVVRHLDADRTNFSRSNLALGTYRENSMDIPVGVRQRSSHLAGSAPDRVVANRNRKLTDEQIREIHANCPTYLVGYGKRVRCPHRTGYVTAMAERYGVSKNFISLLLRGKRCRLEK